MYRVLVTNLPAPPPPHPINQQGDPPTALDPSWVAKAGNVFANVACADTATPFAWCATVIPTTDPGAFPPRTGVYYVSTRPPVAKQPGIEFTAGEVVGTVSADGASVTVTWPPAITQPAGGAVTYQLTLWDLAGCPLQGASCNGHAFIPPQGTCAATATACKVPFAQIIPLLTAENLRSLSVVAVDSGAPPPPPQAMIQGNVTPLVGGGPFGEIRSGTAIGVGLAETAQGRGRGQ